MSENSSQLPLALHKSNLSYLMRPVTLTDTISLHKTLWTDRSMEQIHDFLIRIGKFQQQHRGTGLVVIDNSRLEKPIVGYGQVTQWVNCAEISDLLVDEAYRGRGIGTALIQHLTSYMVSYADCIELGVAKSNPRALALYRRMGFIDSYTLQLDLGQGSEPVIYLQLNLNQYSNLDA